MSEYKKGQRVRVEYVHEGTVIDSDKRFLRMKKDGAPEAMEHWLDLTQSGITITVLDPPDWPPQVGDIWEAEGGEFYVRQSRRKGGELYLTSCRANFQDYLDHELVAFKALNPALVRRRGQ